MKHKTCLLCMALGMNINSPAEAKIKHILPTPHEITEATTDAVLSFRKGESVTIDGIEGNTSLLRFFREFGINKVKFNPKGKRSKVTVRMVDSIPATFNHPLAEYPNEAYVLRVTKRGIEITAVSPMGITRAAQTLTQMAEGWETSFHSHGIQLQGGTITDYPAFKLRGFMHDVGRSFIEYDELKKQVALLSRFKINTFHWHLTENLGWRFEVKAFPQLTAPENMTRQEGRFYTQEQCRDLVQYAHDHGVTIIPEIDIPGHSAAFTKALGYDMQSPQGKEALKKIFREVIDVFKYSPYIHIGGDEVTTTEGYLNEMISHLKDSYGKKIVVWNPIRAVKVGNLKADMCQMWSTGGRLIPGMANIDCRYNYINHFDVYADPVGIYKSSIYYTDKGNADVAGTIVAAWNDTKTASDEQLVVQNNLYTNVLASAERAWKGGGKQYIEKGGTTLPNEGEEYDEYADFERRFLFHKAHSLKNEPIAYVQQCNVRWRITDPFPNGGDAALQFPPETDESEVLPESFSYQGKTYGTHLATGAGVYLRHIWHPVVPSFYNNPVNQQTAYAWTYVYSPKEQRVGAQVEFYTYSRSGNEKGPKAGAWDRRGSKVWVNGSELAAPEWDQPEADIPQDHRSVGLTNENLTARPVVLVDLKQGWNKVFMRLPHVDNGGTGRDKWQFTFVFTDVEGRNAVDGLIYSPTKENAVLHP